MPGVFLNQKTQNKTGHTDTLPHPPRQTLQSTLFSWGALFLVCLGAAFSNLKQSALLFELGKIVSWSKPYSIFK